MKFKDVIWVFFISMLPLIELRGAVPVGAIMNIPFYTTFICAVVGNLLPVPFILIFIPWVLDFMYRFKRLRPIVEWLRKKADKNKDKIDRSAADQKESEESTADSVTPEQIAESAADESKPGHSVRRMPAGAFIGLMLFVLIPAPGTGAWTGSLVASLFGFPKIKSFLAVLLGVIGCGVIMCLASYGVLGFLSFLI